MAQPPQGPDVVLAGGSGGKRAVGVTPLGLDLAIDDSAAIEGFSRVKASMGLTDPRMRDDPIVSVNAAFGHTPSSGSRRG